MYNYLFSLSNRLKSNDRKTMSLNYSCCDFSLLFQGVNILIDLINYLYCHY